MVARVEPASISIARLETKFEARDHQLARMETLLQTLATTHDLDRLRSDLSAVKIEVAALTGLRRTGIGVLIGVAMVAALIGGKVAALFSLILGRV